MKRRRWCAAGLTLVEVLIALVLLSVISLALGSTLVAAQRAQRVSEHWMQALQLAAGGVEELRAGRGLGRCPSQFRCSGQLTPVGAAMGLQRVEVTVEWDDDTAHSYQLSTLVRP
jgi:prepilin-type N-terminal cleavage/methylation domain-containing protein